MISLKPIFLADYLEFKRNKLPKNIGRLFYLSFEDALWDILDKKNVKKNSIILVPEFFCGDVEENIKKHGYRIAYFPVNSKLTTRPKQLIEAIIKYSPKVIVILHSLGINNQLFSHYYWVKYLSPETILIEDCVHKIVDPLKIHFFRKNHFVIDSLRKVIPLQGSTVYSQKNDINFSAPPIFQSWKYATEVTILWFTMNLFWILCTSMYRYIEVSNFFAKQAQKTMKIGYDLIGDSILPARGFFIFDFLQQFIDFERIKKIKIKQVEYYENKLASLPKNIFKKIPYKNSDKAEMMAYPLVLPKKKAKKTLEKIRKNGLLLSFELNDSQWSKKQKIIYLPLGPHLTINNLEQITNQIKTICLVN